MPIAFENDYISLGGIAKMIKEAIYHEIDSDYAARSPEERPNLYPMNFCPFCGRAISRTIWNAEKKK